MAKYFAFHKLKKSAEEVTNALSQGAVQMAQTMASGQTPSKCLKTWTPLTHGRDDYLFCLWEADKHSVFMNILPSIPCRSMRSIGENWLRWEVNQN
jgi:hypothetical protein